MNPGLIVRCRKRNWVLLPSDDENTYNLRPLTGATDEIVKIHKTLANLIGYELPEERVRPSYFPPPSPADLSDAASAHLLWQAARLTLREGAAPFRSLGRISIRPRAYQFVPLLMALRLDPVRLFIADDVGVGKTIEALLIAREFMDRGEIRRLAVLCPPYLCDQWENELKQKFNMDAVVVRSSTIAQLERHKPASLSLYEYYPIQVISIDWVKSERNKYQFLQFCPEMVIVDEVHGAAEASPYNRSQQQRHQLLRDVAAEQRRHLIMLTATPHSGIPEAFKSLLAILKPEFGTWDVANLNEEKRVMLARHFVQRTRKDILTIWEDEHCFPERLTADETYELSQEYRNLFHRTYDFCSEIVRSGENLEQRRRRVRYWGALALLRCVMSSPAAAVTALRRRAADVVVEEGEELRSFIFESSEGSSSDEIPTSPIEVAEKDLSDSERKKLRELSRLAVRMFGTAKDSKLKRCVEVVRELLKEGFSPIIWCRYVATAEYVAQHLMRELPKDVQVVAITGRIGDEERRAKIDEINPEQPRVLVATDCLSEGINLQEKFTAVLHYDLPWNPNRLEQREGRVDRYGQSAKKVKAIRFYGRDNPVDGAVIEVLLNKAKEIHRTLGTYVPVPEEGETITEAVLNALFLRGKEPQEQLRLFRDESIIAFHQQWDQAAERERINRTRFAQRALKPDEVKRELEATDSVLGDPEAVREFVLAAAQRLNMQFHPDKHCSQVFLVNISDEATCHLPAMIRAELPPSRNKIWRVSFVSPTPEGAEYLGRNHRFVAALARFLLEEALTKSNQATASRCGVLRTNIVDRLTVLLLLRIRYLIQIPQEAPLLSEEVLVVAYQVKGRGEAIWLSEEEALNLLIRAKPVANIPFAEKQELIEVTLQDLGEWTTSSGDWGVDYPKQKNIRQKILQRAYFLEESHKRVRKAVSLRIRELKVKPQFPPDLLGVLVLQPVVES